MHEGSLFSTPSPTLIWLFSNRHSNRYEVMFHCGFDLHFPDGQWGWASCTAVILKLRVHQNHLHLQGIQKYRCLSHVHWINLSSVALGPMNFLETKVCYCSPFIRVQFSAINIITMLCNHHHSLILRVFIILNRKRNSVPFKITM